MPSSVDRKAEMPVRGRSVDSRDSWKALNNASRHDVVLAIDFPATGRPEASFADFASRLTTEHLLLETVPPRVTIGTGLRGANYIDLWLAGLADDQPVVAILGYCAGSTYASVMAQRIAARQGTDPVVVLFDPEIPDRMTAYYQFHKVIESFGAVLGREAVAAAQAAGQAAAEASDGDLVGLGGRLFEIFEEYSGQAFDRVGLDAPRRAEFTETFGSFLAYLVAAGDLRAENDWRRSIAITSLTPINGLNLVAPEQREGLVAQEITFEIQHADLLRDDNVAKTVSGLING
jgi:hypothetical protein